MSAVSAKFALLRAVLGLLGAPCLGSRTERQDSLEVPGFLPGLHLCPPVAISCCTVGFKLLRMGPVFVTPVSGAAPDLGTQMAQTMDGACHSSPLGSPSCCRENVPD